MKRKMILNDKAVDQSSLEIDGVEADDCPDFSDAYFSAAQFEDGTPLTDEELEQLGQDFGDVLNDMAHEYFV
jgi:hypothetical protein